MKPAPNSPTVDLAVLSRLLFETTCLPMLIGQSSWSERRS